MTNKGLLLSKPYRLACIVLAAFSLLCTQVPLLNYLGFEFSAFISIVVTFASGLLTISLWQTNGRSVPSLWLFIARSTVVSLSLLVVPLSIISVAALFVKNCSYSEGILFFILIVVPAVLFANAIAVTIAVGLNRWHKTAFSAACFLVLLHILVVTFVRPQIFAFNPVVGFFPGFTHDETLSVLDRLSLYRVSTVAAALFFFAISVVIRRKREHGTSFAGAAGAREVSLLGLSGLILMGFFVFSDLLGFSSSEGFVLQRLGGLYETQHFVIAYPGAAIGRDRIQEIALLHEFYFDEIGKSLQVAPVRKIHSFIYESVAQKEKLIGAARTDIAKPWLRQLHINLDDVESTLKHELVHVMAAEFGFPLLRIGLNPGLMEGLAVAVEGAAYDQSLHRTAAEVLAIGLSPHVESLFSFDGFVKAQPAVSYTLAGSFCRYLIDRYGTRRFKRLYRTGDFAGFYNRSSVSLIAEWKQFLKTIPVSEPEQERAVYLFKRPSIFGKECARVVANLNAETTKLYGRKDYSGALASATRSLEHSFTGEAVFQKANALFKLHDVRGVVEFCNGQLNDTTIAPSLLPLTLLLADSYWALGDTVRALALYDHLLKTHISASIDEACVIRRAIISDIYGAPSARSYFLDERQDSLRERFLRSLQEKSTNPILPYLLGRELMSKGRMKEAVAEFERGTMEHWPLLEFLRRKRLGQVYFRLEQYQRAKVNFWQSLNFAPHEAAVMQIEEWLRRCDWMEKRLAHFD